MVLYCTFSTATSVSSSLQDLSPIIHAVAITKECMAGYEMVHGHQATSLLPWLDPRGLLSLLQGSTGQSQLCWEDNQDQVGSCPLGLQQVGLVHAEKRGLHGEILCNKFYMREKIADLAELQSTLDIVDCLVSGILSTILSKSTISSTVRKRHCTCI